LHRGDRLSGKHRRHSANVNHSGLRQGERARAIGGGESRASGGAAANVVSLNAQQQCASGLSNDAASDATIDQRGQRVQRHGRNSTWRRERESGQTLVRRAFEKQRHL